jgi:hypothetical protein
MSKANFGTHVILTFGFRGCGSCRADRLEWRIPLLRLRLGEPTISHALSRIPHEVEYSDTPISSQGMCQGS